MMTTLEPRQANQALLDAVARLVDERDDLPAGSVLRCFARAVRQVRQAGCPTAQLAVEVERVARAAGPALGHERGGGNW
jgi:hypothetical protein